MTTRGDRGPLLPTGEQFRLRRGEVTATVTELAASLRALRVGGTALVHEYPDELPPPGGSGIVLVPWPNRVARARWTLEGQEQLLDATEPATGNATHGLLRNTGYVPVERTEDAVTLAATVFPQHGYPFLLATSVTYRLEDDGLVVTHDVRNAGDRAAPVAVGAHPYLRAGPVETERLRLTVAADTLLDTDETGIPTGSRPVDGTGLDLRDGPVLGSMPLDTAYTGLTATAGRHRHLLASPDGTEVELWTDPDFGFVQVYLNRRYAGLGGLGTAVAVEPMTAPADALNSGTGLRWLAPQETWLLSWGVRLRSRG